MAEKIEAKRYQVTVRGPAATNGITKIRLPEKLVRVKILNAAGQAVGKVGKWLEQFQLLAIEYPNSPEGIRVTINFV